MDFLLITHTWHRIHPILKARHRLPVTQRLNIHACVDVCRKRMRMLNFRQVGRFGRWRLGGKMCWCSPFWKRIRNRRLWTIGGVYVRWTFAATIGFRVLNLTKRSRQWCWGHLREGFRILGKRCTLIPIWVNRSWHSGNRIVSPDAIRRYLHHISGAGYECPSLGVKGLPIVTSRKWMLCSSSL